MRPAFYALALALPLAGCGLAETAATGAAAGASAAEEARQGLQTEQRVKDQVDAAQQVAAQQLHAADDAAGK